VHTHGDGEHVLSLLLVEGVQGSFDHSTDGAHDQFLRGHG